MIVAIPTYERPALLRKSALPHLRAGASVRVYDSSELATCNENKTMLRSMERDFRTKTPYQSERELVAFIKQLSKQGIDAKIANYALKGGVGAVRNRILLDTVGEKLLMCDDDVVADLRVYGSYDRAQFRKKVSGLKANPENHTNYSSIELAHTRAGDLPKGSSPSDLEDLLGTRVELLWKKHSKAGTASGSQSTGRIVAIQVGSVGDPPGTPWSEFDTVRGGAASLQTREGKGWMRGPQHLIYQPTEFIRTFVLGLDNRLVLPPFLPSESSQGGLFGDTFYGVLLSKAVKGAYTAFLPEIAWHRPEFLKDRTAQVKLPGEVILAEAALQVESLQELSELLGEVEDSAVWASDLVTKAETRIQNDLTTQLAKLGSDVINPRDLDTSVTVKPPSTKQIQDILSFGKLIKAWPEMREASRIIRANGVSLTRPL